MTPKSQWEMANEALMNEQRKQNGEPPSSEEILAFLRGGLEPDEEERIRERLVCYPELMRTLTEPFPEHGAEPGDPDYLSDADFAKQWAVLRNRVDAPPADGRVVPFLAAFTAVAAALAIVFGALLWHARSELSRPRIVQEQLLEPDGRRGPGEAAATLSPRGDSWLLIVPLIGDETSRAYVLEIVDVDAGRSMWRSERLHRGENDSFAVLVPREFLRKGKYQIVLYGTDGARGLRLATYTIRVP
jgi:hypothetical protein